MIARPSYRIHELYLRLKVCLVLITALSLSTRLVWSQTSAPQTASSQGRIARDLELIRIAEQKHLPDVEQGALWDQLALEYYGATEFVKAEDAYNRSLHLLKTAPSAKEEYASTLDNLASLYLIYGRLDDAENARKQALQVRRKLSNPTDIAVSEVHLADIALARHKFKKAEQLALRGLAGLESSLNPPGAGMFSALVTLTYARCSLGHCEEGLMNAEQAVAFAKQNSEPESAVTGFALETLGFAEWKTGATQDGEKAMLEGIQILRTKVAPSDPRLAGAMLQYKAYLVAIKRPMEAREIQDQVERMTSQAGAYCAGCVVSVYSLSKTLR
jgi:tetratricopeptide (TPR) repeat protein